MNRVGIIKIVWLLIAFLSCLLGCNSKDNVGLLSEDLVVVVEIVKGDEIIVEKGNTRFNVRMLGIDAFRKLLMNEEIVGMHQKAKNFLKKEILNKKVKVVFGEPIQDEHKRFLAYVEEQGQDINRLLIEEGYAMIYNRFSFGRELSYIEAEKTAKNNKKNIWAIERLVNLTSERRRVWAEDRKKREAQATDYYLLTP
jgi:endonuclease YncB( thermonuclease family)